MNHASPGEGEILYGGDLGQAEFDANRKVAETPIPGAVAHNSIRMINAFIQHKYFSSPGRLDL